MTFCSSRTFYVILLSFTNSDWFFKMSIGRISSNLSWRIMEMILLRNLHWLIDLMSKKNYVLSFLGNKIKLVWVINLEIIFLVYNTHNIITNNVLTTLIKYPGNPSKTLTLFPFNSKITFFTSSSEGKIYNPLFISPLTNLGTWFSKERSFIIFRLVKLILIKNSSFCCNKIIPLSPLPILFHDFVYRKSLPSTIYQTMKESSVHISFRKSLDTCFLPLEFFFKV